MQQKQAGRRRPPPGSQASSCPTDPSCVLGLGERREESSLALVSWRSRSRWGMRALSGAGAVQCDAGYPSPRPGPVLGSRGVGAPSPFSPARDPGSPLPPERGSQSATRQDEEENGCQVGSRHWPLRQQSGKGSPAPVYAGP